MNARSPLGQHWWAPFFSLAGCAALIDPLRRDAPPAELMLTIAGVIAFIVVFVLVLFDWQRGRSGLWQTAVITLIGVVLAPFNSLAWIFFVVPAAFAASVAAGALRQVAWIVSALIAVAFVETLAFDLPWPFLGAVVGYGIPTAVMTTLTLRRASAVRELARLGERERIARDMHDVLGHTLSVIILKTDLAARLAHENPDRAVQELADVDRIARETLDEVRAALRGYRAKSLEHELDLARHTLAAAGIAVDAKLDAPRLSPAQENVLCLALREGVTNVVRHARAKRCRVAVTAESDGYILVVEDDGMRGRARDAAEEPPRHAAHGEGAGLRGMRERVAELGGSVTQRTSRGTTLTVRLPFTAGIAAPQPVSEAT